MAAWDKTSSHNFEWASSNESIDSLKRREVFRELARLSASACVVYPLLFIIIPVATDLKLGPLAYVCFVASIIIGVIRLALSHYVLKDRNRPVSKADQWNFRIFAILSICSWALFSGIEMLENGPNSGVGTYILIVFAGLAGGGAFNLAADFPLSGAFVAVCWASVALPCLTYEAISLFVLITLYCCYLVAQVHISSRRFLSTIEVREKLRTRGEELEIIAEEARAARAKAEEANLAKARFLATMSHEIRTPLQGVLGMNTLLLGTDLTDEQRMYGEGIENSGQALLGVIEEVLDFSKLEAGKEELIVEEFQLLLLLENSVRVLHQKAVEKGLNLSTDISADLPSSLIGDATHLRQILINVIGNAVKFTKEGSVVLKASVLQELGSQVWITIVVSDTGIGISSDDQAKLFEPFQQLNRETTRAKGGSGLGLSISKRLTQLLGGELKVQSDGAKGSDFILNLPFKRTDSTSSQRTESVKIVKDESLGEQKILLVEDDPTNQIVLKRLLSKAGYSCDVVDDGLKAVQAVEAQSYHLIFMDCQMPVLDGYEASSRIKALLKDEAPPIVAITANATEEDKQSCFDAGMDAFLSKPLRLQALKAVLEQYLGALEE